MTNTQDYSKYGKIDEKAGTLILGEYEGTPNTIPLPINEVCPILGVTLSNLPKEPHIGGRVITAGSYAINRRNQICYIEEIDNSSPFPLKGYRVVDHVGVKEKAEWTKTGHSISFKLPSSLDLFE